MSPDDQRSTAALEVVVTDQRGRPLRKPALVRWLKAVAPAKARGVVTLAFVSDAAMRRINREFAGHDYVTDVLSFPAEKAKRRERAPSAFRLPPSSVGLPPHLGDIVIATGRAERQAAEAGHSVETEQRILALHGLLHVLGGDHAADQGQMARLEARLRRKGGLGEGLIERAGGAGGRRGRA